MNVIHFVALTGIGGVQSQFSGSFPLLCDRDNKRKHYIVTKNVDQGYLLPAAHILNVKKFTDLLFLFYLLVTAKNILHVYNRTTSNYIRFLAIFAWRSKLILHERGNLWNAEESQLSTGRLNCLYANKIICNSNATSKYLQLLCNVPERKLRVLYNGVVSTGVIGKQDRKSTLSLQIAFVGRIEPHKGLSSLLKAMEFLPKDDYFLHVVGDGILKSHYSKQFEKLENVNFKGRIGNVVQFLADEIDVLVVPSVSEPLGNVCLEAGLAQVAVVASNIDGIPEIITHNKTGLLINPDLEITVNYKNDKGGIIPKYVLNPDDGKLVKPRSLNPYEIAEALKKLKFDPALRKVLSENLKANVKRNFSTEFYVQKLISIYNEV